MRVTTHRIADALSRVHLDVARWRSVLADTSGPHVYCFTADTQRGPLAIRSRMFAPAMGIDEDPATGGAAAALAGYVARHHRGDETTVTWSISQGIEIGRPSELLLEVERAGGTLREVRVGGTSVLMGEGTLHIPGIRGNRGAS